MDEVPAFVYDALRFQEPRTDRLRRARDSEWEAVLSSWRVVRLTLPLRQLWDEYLPNWVRDRIDSFLVDNAVHFERIKQFYSIAAAAIRDARAEHVVIKGFSLWPGYVEHPRFRPQSDIDLYCPPDSIFRARDVLSGLGYQPWLLGGHRPSDHLPAMDLPTSWQWRGNFFDPDIPPCFELHSCFWDPSWTRIHPPGLQEFWSRRIERHLDEITFPALHPVDNLGYTALNLLHHLFPNQVPIEQAYGLARFLHTSTDNTFWRNWRLLHDERLRRLEMISFRLVSDWFACRLPEEVQEEIEEMSPPVQAWFRHFSKDATSPHFERRKDSMWLHLSLLESSTDKSIVLLKRLLPIPTRFPTFATVLPKEAAKDPPAEKNNALKVLKFCGESFRYAGWYVWRTFSHLIRIPLALSRGLGFWASSRKLSREFWTFFAASFCFDLGMTMFFFLYNLYILDRGYKEDFVGLMAGAMNVGSIVCTIPAGIFLARLGLRKSLLFSVALVPSVSAARALFAPRSALLGFAFLSGFVTTIWAVAISPAIARLTEEKSRPYAFSFVFSSGIGVGILANLIASRMPGWFVQLTSNLAITQAKQLALLTACCIVALGFFPLSRLRFAPVPAAQKKLYPNSPFLWRFLPALALWSVVTGSLSPLANVYFSQYLRVPLERMGFVFSFSNLLQVVGILTAPFVFRKLGLIPGIASTQLITAVFLGILAATTRPLPAAVVYVGYTGFLWMSQPGLFTLLMDRVAPAEQAGASALNFLVISLAQAAAVAAAGAAFLRFGYPIVLTALAGIALLAAFCFWWTLRGDSPATAKPASARAEL
jgi:predicted MFS family arabinose efflux permease